MAEWLVSSYFEIISKFKNYPGWRALVNTVINLLVPSNAGKFLSSSMKLVS
jgi:predicted NodU family carbamoyl transferase